MSVHVAKHNVDVYSRHWNQELKPHLKKVIVFMGVIVCPSVVATYQKNLQVKHTIKSRLFFFLVVLHL